MALSIRVAAVLCVAAGVGVGCGPSVRSEDADFGGSGGATGSTGSIGVSDTGAPFECPGARVFDGDLSIDDATDLDALRDVGAVTGWLSVANTTNVRDLSFLSCLEEVGIDVSIFRNDGLVSLDGLERLRVIGLPGNDRFVNELGPGLGLLDNPNLEDISAAASLQELNYVVAYGNPRLSEIGLPSVTQLLSLSLGRCPRHADSIDPAEATSVGDFAALESLERLNIEGLGGLTSLGSLHEMAARGVAFQEALFNKNPNLPESEIEAFAAAAGIDPVVCDGADVAHESCLLDCGAGPGD